MTSPVTSLFINELSINEVFKESIPDSYEILVCDFSAVGAAPVRFVVGYTSPGCTYLMDEQLIKALGDISACEHPTIICGDLTRSELVLIDLCF